MYFIGEFREENIIGMEIKTKFDIGQKVFVVRKDSFHKKEECPMCQGEGCVAVYSMSENYLRSGKGQTIECPVCHGYRVIQGKLIDSYRAEETTITKIKISVREKLGTHFSYTVKCDNAKGEMSYPDHENMIFATEDEASIAILEI